MNLIPGFPGYFASANGDITGKRGRVMRGTVNNRGYRTVSVLIDGKLLTPGVHRLVALAFHGPRPEGTEVRHLNGVSLDNRAANLKYGTKSENARDRVAHGTDAMARKTHCPADHEYTPDNLVKRNRGDRDCKRCHADRERARAKAVRQG